MAMLKQCSARLGIFWKIFQNEVESRLISEASIPYTHRVVFISLWTIRIVSRGNIASKAAALAYSAVFAIVPLLATALAFLTALPQLQLERKNLIITLSGYLLPPAISELEGKLFQLSQSALGAGALSGVVFFFVVLFLFETIEKANNQIWQIARPREWRDRFYALSYFLVLFSLTASIFLVVKARLEAIRIDSLIIEIIAAIALFSLAIHKIPNVKMRWSSAIYAAIVFGLIWHFSKNIFTWYVFNMASYNNIYGALAAIPIFFLWVYLSFFLLLSASALARVIERLPNLVMEEKMAQSSFPWAYLGVRVVLAIANISEARRLPPSKNQIATELKLPSFVVSKILQKLTTARVVFPVLVEDDLNYLLSPQADRLSLWDIIGPSFPGYLFVTAADDIWVGRGELCDIFQEAQTKSMSVLAKVHIGELKVKADRVA